MKHSWLIIFLSFFIFPQTGYTDAFTEGLQQRIQDEPDNGYNYYTLGLYNLKKGKKHSGIRNLKTAYSLEPESLSILYDLGDALLQSGNAREALPYLQKYLKRKPGDLNTLARIASAKIQLGNISPAKKILSTLQRRRAPGSIIEVLQFEMGQYYYSKKKYFSAERILKKVQASSNTHLASQAFATLGMMQAAQGRFKNSVNSLNRALTLDYQNSTAYYSLAYLFESQGRFKKAAETWHLASIYTSDPERKDFCLQRMKKLSDRAVRFSSTTRPRR